MYEAIGRWVIAAAVTAGCSVGLIFLLENPIHDIVKINTTFGGMVAGAVVASFVSVLIGPIAQGILRSSKKDKK